MGVKSRSSAHLFQLSTSWQLVLGELGPFHCLTNMTRRKGHAWCTKHTCVLTYNPTQQTRKRRSPCSASRHESNAALLVSRASRSPPPPLSAHHPYVPPNRGSPRFHFHAASQPRSDSLTYNPPALLIIHSAQWKSVCLSSQLSAAVGAASYRKIRLRCALRASRALRRSIALTLPIQLRKESPSGKAVVTRDAQ